MIYDLQKANVWKRISAYLFDLILLIIVIVGAAFLLSVALGYDAYSERLESFYTAYEERYGVSFDITSEEYEKLSETDLQRYEDALTAFSADEEVNYVYTMVINLTLLVLTFSILFGYLILEFVVPLFLKNGQTLGKKIFGIALMRTDGVRLQTPQLFIRTVLGKYTVETMVPVLILLMIYLNFIGMIGTAVIFAFVILQTVLLFATRTRSPIHDLLAGTVAVDLSSQMIFDSQEDLIAYKKRIHEEKAARAEYP